MQGAGPLSGALRYLRSVITRSSGLLSRIRRAPAGRRAALAVAPATLSLAFLATACGVPTAAAPQVLSGLPANILQPAAKFHRLIEPVARNSFDVYFVENGELIGVPRPGKASPTLALHYLYLGPSSIEEGSGITTAVPFYVDASLVRIEDKNGRTLPHMTDEARIAVVNLNLAAVSTIGVAQIVWTVTVPPIKEVLFLEAGQPVAISSGVKVSHPVTREDFENYYPS